MAAIFIASMANSAQFSPRHRADRGIFRVPNVMVVHPCDIQYRGSGPALIDLLAGQVQVGFDAMPASIEYIRAGGLRALAVCTATRSHALPDIPTVGEFVPGYEASGYFGFGAPARTPAEIIDKLTKGANAGLADPKLKTQLADLGGIILGGSSADFRTLIYRRNRETAQGDLGGQHLWERFLAPRRSLRNHLSSKGLIGDINCAIYDAWKADRCSLKSLENLPIASGNCATKYLRQRLPHTAKAVRGRPANAVRDRAPLLFQAGPRGVRALGRKVAAPT